MSATQNYVTKEQFLSTSYAMIALTSIFAIARIAIRVTRPKALVTEDYLVFIAYILFIAMSILYIVVAPTLFRMSEIVSGEATPDVTMIKDDIFIIKVFFANAMIFWIVLWTVKFSLLALSRRLMMGLNSVYMRLWWGVFGFCVATLIGCIASSFTSCHSMHAWFTPGECISERDVRAQFASLYYAFAVDVISDLMIMFLPIRLIWNLQMPRAQKLSVVALFCTGFVCIFFAIIRIVQIGVKADNSTTPSTSWLAFWAIIECSIAVIIGCCPAFAALYRTTRNTQRAAYSVQGYAKQPSGRSDTRDSNINLTSLSRSKSTRNASA
ncbi:uncharacterized protein BDR25DRAFT_386509 [Lindgomyces ingoldianus]|uniref:Uncharacterized protein n=1 Tax=Lindgomyces ingoldianus TaxID=673940 RepID=A0ACB6R5V3_9PLEO|nr:uncharacterized protein BDR25DRAFT_386509 [Lindgomyces ingoldianus]KAF2473677.1 hypothetical protein BDR25DRAFT_386509 [Lindgomyces ingoldianus]